MSIIGILKIMEVQEDDKEVQEEAVLFPQSQASCLSESEPHFQLVLVASSCTSVVSSCTPEEELQLLFYL